MRSIISLTAEDVDRIAAAARAEAIRLGLAVTIVVVDAGGHVWRTERLDGALLGSISIAEEKARTAALFGQPTKFFEERVAIRSGLIGARGILALQGGVPIIVDGEVVGGIAASGATSQEDELIASAGAREAGTGD